MKLCIKKEYLIQKVNSTSSRIHNYNPILAKRKDMIRLVKEDFKVVDGYIEIDLTGPKVMDKLERVVHKGGIFAEAKQTAFEMDDAGKVISAEQIVAPEVSKPSDDIPADAEEVLDAACTIPEEEEVSVGLDMNEMEAKEINSLIFKDFGKISRLKSRTKALERYQELESEAKEA